MIEIQRAKCLWRLVTGAILGMGACQATELGPENLLWTDSGVSLSAPKVPGSCADGFSKLIDLNEVALSQDEIVAPLFGGTTLVAHRRSSSVEPNRSHWIGEVEGYPGSTFALVQHKGAFTGTIQYGDALLEIVSLGENNHVLCMVDQSQLPSGCKRVHAEYEARPPIPTLPDIAPSARTFAATETEIDVMVLYTRQARDTPGAISGKIGVALQLANQSYRNSRIPIKLRLAHTALVGSPGPGSISTVLRRLRLTNDGTLDQIHRWRDNHQADVVVLVVSRPGPCGLGYVMTTPSSFFAPFAFSVINERCLTANHTLAHEIGHNQGNAHDHDTSQGLGFAKPYSFGFRRCDLGSEGFRTIMSYPCQGARSVPYINHFSNPRVRYRGHPTGIAHPAPGQWGAADAARSMTETAAIVAGFRGNTQAPPSRPPAPALLAPSHLTGIALSQTAIRVSWRDNSSNESMFIVEQRLGASAWSPASEVRANLTSLIVTGLRPDTVYRYRVKAKHERGDSAYSNSASVRTLPVFQLPSLPR